MDKNTAKVLRKARALIEQPERWGQGFRIERPDTYCAGEALNAAGADNHAALTRAREIFKGVIGGEVITIWNDHRVYRHVQVLAAFDKAIALAEAA